MAEMHTQTETRSGTLKWFDVGKGFGFILDDDGGPDILLHANVLRSFGQSSVGEGARIDFVVARTDRGLQAVEVLKIHQSPDLAQGQTSIAETGDASTPIYAARVKWFDKGKGFGFANVFGDDADVFVHADVLRVAGLADLLSGEAIALRATMGERGLTATEVLPWDSAISER